ncbi:hypothetical protein AAK894_13225 [Lachnospiraceae bacterium 46-61]
MQSNKLPQWFDLSVDESISIHLRVYSDAIEAAFNTVKKSTLPQEIIDDLTEEGAFIGVLTKAGFGVGHITDDNNAPLVKEVLDTYTEKFLNIIAPYVSSISFIEMEDEYGLLYKWEFNGSACSKVYND